ncbi:hypothetical protein ACHAQD_007693 [Fusarium lateritium]
MFWAVICAATAGVTTWQGLLVLRFFLGFTESIVPTAFMITVSGYYTQSEQALRQSWWFSGTGWFTVIGSALNYGFAQIDGGALKSWQYIYVLAGGLTFLFGLWCFALPNSVLNAWFLTEEERLVAIERLRAGHTGLKSNKIEFYQVKEAVLDVKVWLVALMMASAIRIPVLLLCCLPVIAGFAIIWKSEWGTRPVAPVVGYSIIGFFGPVVSLTVTLGAANVAGETKKSFMASAVFVAYCVGNIIGPQLVRSEEKAQHYPQLWTGLIIWVLTRDGNKPPAIPSLSDLIGGRADKPVQIPSYFPCENLKTPEVNSRQLRYSDTAAHEYLHSNLPPSVMAFTQEPIPEIVPKEVPPQYGPIPVFRHREVIRSWVGDILAKNQNNKSIEFNTSVELAEKVGDEWILTLRKELPKTNSNYWWQERFDALIVASGHYHLPSIPDIPGLIEYDKRFPGRIKHTKHYDTADEFKGKRVVVVGGSVSAFDALHDVKRTAKLPIIISLRRPSAVFGWAPFEHPHIKQRPSISSFDPVTGRITFSDGTFEDDIDVVVFATGFEFSFSFLPGIKPVNKRIPGLYQHVFKSDDPSLAFIGMVTGGFGLRIFEWQAVAAARHFAGRAILPSLKEMREWEQQRLEEKGDGPAFWTLLPDFEKHYEALRAIAGDPAPGTSGRVLPKYDEKWGESFWELINARIAWWREEARGDEKKSNTRVLKSSKLA